MTVARRARLRLAGPGCRKATEGALCEYRPVEQWAEARARSATEEAKVQ